jgi:hypothetical protein
MLDKKTLKKVRKILIKRAKAMPESQGLKLAIGEVGLLLININHP